MPTRNTIFETHPKKRCCCPTCPSKGKEIPIAMFGRNKSSPDGHHWYCKHCFNAYMQAWKQKNVDRVRAAKQEYDARKKRERLERRLLPSGTPLEPEPQQLTFTWDEDASP